jgi:hypothetical protein
MGNLFLWDRFDQKWRSPMAEAEKQNRRQVSVVMDEILFERLEAAAKQSVRSLNGEINFRLKQSLASTAAAAG